MNDDVDILLVRSVMFEPGTPDREAHDRARARFIASAVDPGKRRAGRFAWSRRNVGIGGISVPVVVLGLVVTAAAAAATGAIVAVNATTVFENNPQQQLMPSGSSVPAAAQETVIPASVRQLATATIPDYGQVQFWGAPTKQGGFCFAIKLPDGTWGGYPLPEHARGGWLGGSVPGCTSTQQRAVIAEPAVPSGQQPSAANGDLVGPIPVEQWQQQIKSNTGQIWNLSFGYVEVQGTAATVRDPDNGVTAAVSADGYYLLIEPTKGGGDGDLQALDASGQTLQPDYTYGGTLPGYPRGPSQS